MLFIVETGGENVTKLQARAGWLSGTQIAVFCSIIAAVRVLVFAALFPLFNNVDERAHADLVLKYAHGEVPDQIERYSDESAHYFALYSTPEYFLDPKQEAYGQPVWTLPADERERVIEAATQAFHERANHESGEPPLYYAIAGLWLNLGRACHISGARLLYWVRFLNALISAAIVWLGFFAARSFDDNRHLRFTVPLLLALWSQTTFYSITSDSLSPLSFGICFVGVVTLFNAKRPGFWLGAWIGVSLATTCLTKTANLPLVLIVFLAVLLHVLKSQLPTKERSLTLAGFLVSAAIPLAIWFEWNRHQFGDLTATQSKIELLGWTRKPLREWWSHPVLTFQGAGEFWSQLIASFWRGEFIWHGHRLAWPVADSFYWMTSTAALIFAVTILFTQKHNQANKRAVLLLATASFLILIGFMLLLSIRFDFHSSPYPSREHPFFVSGRLLSAAAIPFFLVYGFAFERLVTAFKTNWTRPVALGAMIVFLILAQLITNWPTFSSQYNFFYTPAF